MAEELFDVVDEADQVLRQAPRSQVHAQRWLHRAVHIFIFNTRGELLIHQRSATKDEAPLQWNSSASGHVAAGEDYDLSAQRELAEELGLHVPLERLNKFAAAPELAQEHTVLYRATTNIPPVCDPGEIARAEFVSLAEVRQRLKSHRAQFSVPFQVVFEWYCQNYAGS